jgi:2'-5' RNA ligase
VTGAVGFTCGATTLFEGDDKPYDVVKVDVESKDLVALNEAITTGFPCTDDHPDYHPHITLAYVKKGLGKKYTGDRRSTERNVLDLEGETAESGELDFSDGDGKHTALHISGGCTTRAKLEKNPSANYQAGQRMLPKEETSRAVGMVSRALAALRKEAAPKTLFQSEIAEVREEQKQVLKELVQEKVDEMVPKVEKDLTGKGYKVNAVSGSASSFRGNPYIASFKVSLQRCKDPDKLAEYLRGKYSPKFNYLGKREDGHLFSIRGAPVNKEANDAKREYSCLMLTLPPELSEKVRSLSDAISEDDLYHEMDAGEEDKYGREKDPHITVKYGIHTKDPEEIREFLDGVDGPVRFTCGATTLFESEDKPYDVVKVDIDSDHLHAINEAVSDGFPCTDTHPEYHPHITLAYVKKGEGKRYTGRQLAGFLSESSLVDFSDGDGNHTPLRLGAPAEDSLRKAAQDEEPEALLGVPGDPLLKPYERLRALRPEGNEYAAGQAPAGPCLRSVTSSMPGYALLPPGSGRLRSDAQERYAENMERSIKWMLRRPDIAERAGLAAEERAYAAKKARREQQLERAEAGARAATEQADERRKALAEAGMLADERHKATSAALDRNAGVLAAKAQEAR